VWYRASLIAPSTASVPELRRTLSISPISASSKPAFRELRHVPVIKIRSGDVNQFGGLFLNGRHHLRVAMACRADRDARGEIQEGISVRVFHNWRPKHAPPPRVIAAFSRRATIYFA